MAKQAVGVQRQVRGVNSIIGGGTLGAADVTLQLRNDVASPGNNKVYGTDAEGRRGWKDDPTGGGGTGDVPSTRSITGAKSISGGGTLAADRTLELDNDVESPGNDKYYGTNGVGTKGWHALPPTGGLGIIDGGTSGSTYPPFGPLDCGGA